MHETPAARPQALPSVEADWHAVAKRVLLAGDEEAVVNYDEMPAGVEMDRLAAERVMGLTKTRKPVVNSYGEGWFWSERVKAYTRIPCAACDYDGIGETFRPSANIAHAWEVVEAMEGLGFRTLVDSGSGQEWVCWFAKRSEYPRGERIFAMGPAPLAICRAALKAVASSRPNGGEGTATVPG